MKLGEKSAEIVAYHNSMTTIVQQAIGGDKAPTNSPPPRAGDEGVKDLAEGHASVEDAISSINQAMLIG